MTRPASRRLRRVPAIAFASLCLALLAGSGPLATAAPAARVELRELLTAKSFDRFIVRFRAGSAPATSDSALAAALERAGARATQAAQRLDAARGSHAIEPAWQLQRLRRLAVGADVVRVGRKLDRGQARLLMQQLAADPDVEYVEVDRVMHASFTPNDTSYVNEWGLTDSDAGIRADKAWDLGTGGGAVVAVIDTGYTDHSDLAANILPGYDFVTDPTRANDGDGRDGDAHDPGNWTDTSSSNWHGTHVAGTIAAVTNNGQGVAGVAFSAKVVPVRVLGVGGGDGSDIADAIVWASGGSVPGAPVNANPAEVLNLSLGGGGGCGPTYQAAIDSAVGRGTIVVVAAGNDNLDTSGGSLSTCNNVVVAGAHTSTSSRSSFSNYGPMVDVSAPGSSILSTINTGTTVPAAEGYAYYQGTSMATPHIAGAAALAQAYRVAKGLSPYTPAQLEAQIKATAYPMRLGCAGSDGAGVLDARTLLDTADGSFKLLADGVVQANQSASSGGGLRYVMVASSQADGLTFSTSGGSGNADLYVKFGSAPTTSVYDCRSNAAGNLESCTIPVASQGAYYVLLQATSTYSGVSLTGALGGNRKPVASFSNSASGLDASFTDTSTDADDGIASRTWNFGDGSSTTSANPVHSYGIAGAYTVQLTAKDVSGSSNCTLKQVNVNPASVALANGVPVANLAANIGAQLPFTLAVPAGATSLNFNTAGGSGDADLYVKFGSPPTLSDFDCVSGSPTTTESCDIATPQAGTWYVLVDAYSNISGVTLTGSYVGGAANQAPVANFNFSTSALTANFTDASTDSDGSIASRSWDFGDGTSSTSTNPSHTYASAGNYNAKLTVTDNGGLSNSLTKQVSVSQASGVSVSIADVQLDEGNSGTRTMSFKVQLSAAASGPVKYNIATSDGSAQAPGDYTAKSLSALSIPAGTLSKVFTVVVKGDVAPESDETFNVTLSNVTGASVADGQAVGTIRNDDGTSGGATLSVNDVTLAEGTGGTKQFVFTVSLSQAVANDVSYAIATANGTATTANNDYVASSLAGQVIPAGQTSKTFSVTVNGDAVHETNERFKVNVSAVTGATVLDAQGIGIISNDD